MHFLVCSNFEIGTFSLLIKKQHPQAKQQIGDNSLPRIQVNTLDPHQSRQNLFKCTKLSPNLGSLIIALGAA